MIRTMSRSAGAMTLAVGLILGATACSGSSTAPATAAPVKGGKIHIALGGEPTTLDPAVGTALATGTVDKNVFEGLVAPDKNGVPQGVLAEKVQASSDNTTFDFTLRSGVSFQNGAPLTTDDVIASVNRWIKLSSFGKQYFTGSTITSPSTNLVRIQTPHPLSTALYLLADSSMAVMPASIAAKTDPAGITEIVGTGPYQLGTWTKGQNIELTKYKGYVSPKGDSSGLTGEKKAMLDSLIFDIVSEESTRTAGMLTGKYDYAPVPADSLAQVKANANVTTVATSGSFQGMVFNKRSGIMANQTMRHAVEAVMDEKAILTGVNGGPDFFELNGAFAQKGTPTYAEAGLDSYNKPDPAQVKKLLTEAGYNGETVKFLTTKDYPTNYNGAVIVQQQLKKAGINVELTVVDFATWQSLRKDDTKWDLFNSDWAFAPSPASYRFLQSDYAGWTNSPEITAALNGINASTSDSKLKDSLNALQTAIYTYLPLVKYGDVKGYVGLSKSVGGYGFSTGAGEVLYNMYRTDSANR